MRLTVAQALVRFLAAQHTERDGVQRRLIAGCFGIFGHGNVAGIGQALLEAELAGEPELPYHHARNEQGMVHAAVGYARMRDRLSTLACTSSIGPGATNMVTGAALATINRLPVLLLPGDIFATRVGEPGAAGARGPALARRLGQRRLPARVALLRPHQPARAAARRALLAAMRVLTDPVETGAVTLALPQDVQAEAYDWPEELFERRVWHVRRPPAEPGALAEAAALLRGARRPLIVAGGGAIYAERDRRAARARRGDRDPRRRDAGRQGLAALRPPAGASARSAPPAPPPPTRSRARPTWCSASAPAGATSRPPRGSVFAEPGVRFVNLNVAPVDAHKQSGARARRRRARRPRGAARGARGLQRRRRAHAPRDRARARVGRHGRAPPTRLGHGPLPAQSEVIGVVNRVSGPRDVVVCAAGSMPGDLHKLWRTRDPKGYHVEYGYSCMGYEIAGGLGREDGRPGARGVRAWSATAPT